MEPDDPQGSVTQEYAPIGGEADFCRESAKLAFGDTSPVVTNGLNVTVQVTEGPSVLPIRDGSGPGSADPYL